MGDFILDLRDRSQRRMDEAGAFLRFFPDQRVTRLDDDGFSVIQASSDDDRLWSPARSADGGRWAMASGRIVLDEAEWQAAEGMGGDGGVAARHILARYEAGGAEAVGQLDGHYVVVVVDWVAGQVQVITDRWGLAPCFRYGVGGGEVFGSHPDALARAIGESPPLDTTSLAEFVLTSRVSAPFSYYRGIEAVPVATVVTVGIGEGLRRGVTERRYFEFRYDPQPVERTEAVADELAAALGRAASRRSLPRFGRTAVALSGGLDSRTLLCATGRPAEVLAFCCHDEENEEFRLAQAIAREAGAEFLPLRRGPEFYGETARLGVRISGGLGSLASNHFLGIRESLRTHGIGSLLTGCYWDYLFKALGFNKQVNRWTTLESVGPFGYSYYARHLSAPTAAAAEVQRRLESVFPERLRADRSEAGLAALEHERLFPLFYEEDSTARSIPQRVMPWYIPFADAAVMEARLKMGSAMKLNRRAMIRVCQHLCGPRISGIPDANTGVAVGSPVWLEAASSHAGRLRRRLARLRSTRATTGSWINWGYYIRHSPVLRACWEEPNADADALFDAILGPGQWPRDVDGYTGRGVNLFLRLLTLKIWLHERG